MKFVFMRSFMLFGADLSFGLLICTANYLLGASSKLEDHIPASPQAIAGGIRQFDSLQSIAFSGSPPASLEIGNGLTAVQAVSEQVRAEDVMGFSGSNTNSTPSIVINHTSVSLFDDIPDAYVTLIKKQKMIASYLGGSHARQMHYGLRLLEGQNPKYAADIAYNPSSYSNRSALRDLTGKYTAQYRSWSDMGGSSDYWQNDSARKIIADTIKQAKSVLGYPVSVSLFGWSYHMLNPVYASNALGHAFGDQDLQLYLDALDRLNADPTINETKFVYHTSVTDSVPLSSDSVYNMNRWNETIRQFAASKGGILFDQADIEHWNNSNTAKWSERDYAGRTVYLRHPDYLEVSLGGPGPDTYTGDHANDALEIRKAKALWVLMARLAGWDADRPTLSVRITLQADSGVKLQWRGEANADYSVLMTTNVSLPAWEIIGRNIAGTPPTNSYSPVVAKQQSCFFMVRKSPAISASIARTDGSGVKVQWPSDTNAVYSVLLSTNLALSGWKVIESNIVASPPANSYVWSLREGKAAFFRIRKD